MNPRLAGKKITKIIKKNYKLVEAKKIEIEKILEENREEIEAGRLVVYIAILIDL